MKNSAMTKKKWLLIAAAILVVAAVVVIAISAKPNEATGVPGLMNESQTGETEAPALVYVETTNYEFAFDARLSEIIFYRELADTAEDDFEFYTKINDQEHVVFTLVFNCAEGDIVHMIDDAQGNKIPVAFMMKALPEGLDEEAADDFFIAQGVVNEVVASIKVH